MGLLGAHVSIAGGLHHAFERGESIGGEAIQIFAQPSRTWVIPELTEDEVAQFRAARKASKKIKSVMAHNSYLLNLSTADAASRRKSIAYFIRTMERCEALGLDGLITHPGSHMGAGVEEGLRWTAESLDEILEACRGFKTPILLENTAGQGACVGCHFEHLERIIDGTRQPDRIFLCFDTQHAFAAGYDLRTTEGYEATMSELDRRLTLKKLLAFHVNDSVKDLGCRVDRHEAIGKGYLGKEAFRLLVNDRRFAKVPMFLETNPGDDMENHRREIKLLRSLKADASRARAR